MASTNGTSDTLIDDCDGPHRKLLNEHEAAAFLGLSVGTMRRRRLTREPPLWVKLGRRVLYRRNDLEFFVNANLIRINSLHSKDRRERSRAAGTSAEATSR